MSYLSGLDLWLLCLLTFYLFSRFRDSLVIYCRPFKCDNYLVVLHFSSCKCPFSAGFHLICVTTICRFSSCKCPFSAGFHLICV